MDATEPALLCLAPLAKTLDSLHDALDSLRDALDQPKTPSTRDATISRFEYAFELSWRCLRRYLAFETAVDPLNLKELFRQAGQRGIIANVEAWFTYLKGGTLTSHTYNEKMAEESYQLAAAFLDDAQDLLNGLVRRCEHRGH